MLMWLAQNSYTIRSFLQHMKKKWIILLGILALISSVYLYFAFRKSKDFEPQIKARLAKMVSDASQGLYKLDLDHIEIDITAASVTAKNILLSVDSVRMKEMERSNQLGNDIYNISLKQINLDGLSPVELLDGKNISLDHLVLDSPEIKITRYNRNKEKNDTGGLYKKMSFTDESYSLRSLLLNDIRLTIIDLAKNKSVSSLKNLSAFFTDIKIDSSTVNDSTRFLFAKDAAIFIKGFKRFTEKKRYHFNIDSIVLRPQYGNLEFYDMTLKPEGTKEDFNKLITHQQDRYDIKLKKGTVKNINWFSLLAADGFYGDEINAEGGTVNIYHDRRLPDGPPKSNNFPHQMLMSVDLPVSIKKILLKDFSIFYEELNPKSMHTGTVAFYNVNGEINDVTNIKDEIKKLPYATINATADFMNTGKLSAVFRFDLANVNNGNFSVDATLGSMDGKVLNKLSEGLALIKFKTLKVDQLKTHISGSSRGATGNVIFAYHDLSFDVLKNDDGEMKKRGLFSFIANNIMVNKSNPKKEKEKAKQFTVYHQHQPERSFFNLIWKTLLEGILKTVK